jgi:divinyl protochlorophyllide a 8-vinyl-reductase
MSVPAAVGADAARIGPNAIIQTLAALRERVGGAVTEELLRAAGLTRYAAQVPSAMVPEHDVSDLFHALRGGLDESEATACARLAGSKTADYVLAHRIPRPAQFVLRLLPPRLAAPVLLASITKHTWTFAGSGSVSVPSGAPVRIAIVGCPVCRGTRAAAPTCGYYAASFEGLFRALVTNRARVAEIACQATGAQSCVFEVRW